MIYTEPIEYLGIDDIRKNIDYYYNKFVQDSLLVFRNANLNYIEQEELLRTLGDYFGWFPKTNMGQFAIYEENHSRNVRLKDSNCDQVILPWHVEHPYLKNSIVASIWNMSLFKTNPENGKTYFVDTSKIYELLNKNEQDFLNKSVASASFYHQNEILNCKVIEPHWITKKPTIRCDLNNISHINNELMIFDDNVPNDEQKENYKNIIAKIINEIANNESLRIVHRWQQGDLVVPDLYRLAHAITGGFDPSDRFFGGSWAWEFNNL